MFGIFKNEFSERQRELFADQFEAEGDGFVYRKSQKGPAIRVSTAERERFIADYDRRQRHSTWVIIVGLSLLVLAFAIWSVVAEAELSDPVMYLAISSVAAMSIGYMLWSWGAPARELQRRTPVAGERSRDEMKRRMLAKLSYRQLASTALLAVVACWSLAAKSGFAGWGRLWLGLAGLTVVFTAISAFRKWRFDQR